MDENLTKAEAFDPIFWSTSAGSWSDNHAQAAEIANSHVSPTMTVTRLEEWCVDASSPEEARALLEAGQGHRCHLGELVQIDLDRMLDD